MIAAGTSWPAAVGMLFLLVAIVGGILIVFDRIIGWFERREGSKGAWGAMMTKGSENEFKAAATLLERLWFVEPQWVDAETRSIDWDAIREAMHRIVPSDGELILYKAALMLWNGREPEALLARAMRTLDEENWTAFMAALETKRPVLRVGAAP